MPLSPVFTQHLEAVLQQQLHRPVRILQSDTITGGHINKTWLLQSDAGDFIIKINDAVQFPFMFAGEAAGLRLIASTHTVATPQVIATGEYMGIKNRFTYLILERITTGTPDARSMQLLGQQLAALHRHSAPQYGLSEDFMSFFPQSNAFHDTWPAFFIQERLQPMVKRATDAGRLDACDLRNFDTLYKKLDELVPGEPPALVHGDCWSGNCMVNTQGIPYLIDPAAYYGHREVDICMTQLFGGFSQPFYEAYQEVWPLQKGWEQRMGIWQLYPLLILNLFGPDYQQQLRETLKKYV